MSQNLATTERKEDVDVDSTIATFLLTPEILKEAEEDSTNQTIPTLTVEAGIPTFQEEEATMEMKKDAEEVEWIESGHTSTMNLGEVRKLAPDGEAGVDVASEMVAFHPKHQIMMGAEENGTDQMIATVGAGMALLRMPVMVFRRQKVEEVEESGTTRTRLTVDEEVDVDGTDRTSLTVDGEVDVEVVVEVDVE